MEEHRAESWEDAIQFLFDGDWNAAIGRNRSSFAFRGTTSNWPTMPTSLARLGGNYSTMEGHLLRNFRKYAHREAGSNDSFWHWLTLGQHHGLPTRLLDWTYSPLVALHFATDDLARMQEDGVVWAIDIDNAHSRLPKALSTLLDQEGASVFTVDMLAEFSHIPTETIAKAIATKTAEISLNVLGANLSLEPHQVKSLKIESVSDLEKLHKDPVCFFLEPPSIDDRVINQYALFSIISKANCSMDEWMSTTGVEAKKLTIPHALKWMIRDRLDQANISERTIYPGLDGISRWLKRHYSPVNR